MSPTKQTKKEEIISGLPQVRGEIVQVAQGLPPEKQDEVFLGVWAVKDLLAHLIGWDYTNLAAVAEILAGELPGFYAHYDKDWAGYNAKLVDKYRREDFGELLAALEVSHQELLTCLASVSAEDFEKDWGLRARGYKVTIARLMQAELQDEREHLAQIQGFIQTAYPIS